MAERNCKRCFHYKACKEVASHSGYIDINYTESQCKHFIPTADVVPKSEVEKIFAELEGEIKLALDSNYKARRQVEISDALYYTVSGKISALRGIDDFLAELKKKKYIGEQENEM